MKRIVFLFFVVSSSISFSQEKKIKYEADIQNTNEDKYPGGNILIGNVKLIHEGIVMTSQKALFYKKENFFKAIGNVYINQGDTITQTSDYTDYDANAKQALSWGNVVLKDPTMTITSDTLHFDRVNQKLFYNSYATIKDSTNTLNSKIGNYYLEDKKFTAKTKVTVINPEHHITSKHLDYFTESGIAFLFGPSTIINKKDSTKIYCERGFYNTKTDISYFVKNAQLFSDQRVINADSIYYDKNRGFASATNNITVRDTVENFTTKGHYSELFEQKDSLFIIKKAVAITIVKKDSTFFHGDTIMVTGKPENRMVRVYHNAKIFKSDLQGKCDSIHTNQVNGLTKMFKNPILWSDKNQITGDSIHLISNPKTDKLDSIKVLNHAFIISKDSLSDDNFSQIKGRNMFGKFEENKVRFWLVKGNSETVFYNRNEKTSKLESITKEISSRIEFELINGGIKTIKYITQSEGKTYPPSKLPEEVKKLKGFIWREDEQPKKMEDIFIKTKLKPTKKGKKNGV